MSKERPLRRYSLVQLEKERVLGWQKISVCGKYLPFTGADVTAISEESYKSIKGKGGKLVKPSKLLQGPSNQPLPVVGEFIGSLAYEGRSKKHQIFVVKGLKNNLLGLPAIRSMGLVVRVNEVTSSYKDKILVQYPALFRGLETLGEPYEIKLKRNSKPVSLFAPRRVPIPFHKQVQTELDQMEALGAVHKRRHAKMADFDPPSPPVTFCHISFHPHMK